MKQKNKYKETFYLINETKLFFQKQIEKKLNLHPVVGPLILDKSVALNDYLVEDQNAIVFHSKELNKDIEIVQSLAKWKRFALKKYNFEINEGLYVDMKAIRSHEKPDYLHSIFVDQWDWELIIYNQERTKAKLKQVVEKIYDCILSTQNYVNSLDKNLHSKLPHKIYFFETQELEDEYPNLTFEEIVEKVAQKYQAIFIIGIGKKLKSGKVFDLRSPEYDDWKLNGDLILWSDKLNHSIEISSMGIRVNKESLISQTQIDAKNSKLSSYYKGIINEELDQTIGGGIGQSRLLMFLLEKTHIGEVQPSIWDDNELAAQEQEGKQIL